MEENKKKKSQKKKKQRKPSFFIYYFLAPFILLFAKIKFGIKVSGDKLRKKHPTLIIAPHRSYYDFFYAPYAIYPRRAHFVSTTAWFRNKWLAIVLNWLKTIPKDQYRSDLKSIVRIGECIKNGHDIIIFPEGQISLDGKSLFLPKGLDKLISKFKPDVMYLTDVGSYLTSPKWAKKIARGHVYIERQLIIKSEDIDKMSLEEINNKIIDAFRQSDDLAWIETRENEKYVSKKKALGLDSVIMRCPSCGKCLPFSANGNTLSCDCGFTVEFDKHSYELKSSDNSVSNLSELMKNDFRKFEKEVDDGLVLEDEAHFTYYTDTEENPLYDGKIRMDKDKIEIIHPTDEAKNITVEVAKTINLVVALGKRLEIPTPTMTIKAVMKNPKRAVLYWNYMNYVKRKEQETNETINQ